MAGDVKRRSIRELHPLGIWRSFVSCDSTYLISKHGHEAMASSFYVGLAPS